MTQTQTRYSIIAAGAIITVLALGSGTVLASEGFAKRSFAAQLANRFNLDQEEVQAFLDDHHEEMKTQHEAKMQEHLEGLTINGTLSADQASALQAKLEEMHVATADLSDMNKEERMAAMQARHDEMQQWAKEHYIPLDALWQGHRGPKGMHHLH